MGLQDPANKDILDYCGPIGFIQLNDTVPYPKQRSTPALSPVALHDLARSPKTGISLNAQYLANITVGEDYANCYSCANSTTCNLVTRYRFEEEVWVQCWYIAPDGTGDDQYWYETTDFCYVREVDFFQSLFDCKSMKLDEDGDEQY
jgi:hypothetical protein